MNRTNWPYRFLSCLVLFAACAVPLFAQAVLPPWLAVGPNGGDARSFAADPTDARHLYMGTTDGWLYQSHDGGASWQRLPRLASEDNLVVDNIVVSSADPKTVLAAVWIMDHNGGSLFVSHDGGESWRRIPDMDGQSIRSLAQAPSNSRLFVAGTLSGVYRSTDGAEHWTQISPPASTEIHEVESVAIDPANPDVIYAGTWHLPWKTSDGGEHWHTIKQGVIDDSDVFSIIIDPTHPPVVYASACSGIYKSENGGELFRKVQGIPSTARRTRVLQQDPSDRKVVYAGTTEGLYRTQDAGVTWTRLTGPNLIINDVYVSPSDPKHVLLATDRSGVLASDDGGLSFHDANAGFTQRQVTSVAVDPSKPSVLYAGVINDKEFGGVFTSRDGGRNWLQQSQGLGNADVFSVGVSPAGVLLAGTRHGILRWDGQNWVQSGKLGAPPQKAVNPPAKVKRAAVRRAPAGPPTFFDARVTSLNLDGPVWYAATSNGVYQSSDQGENWQGGPLFGLTDFLQVNTGSGMVIAAGRHALALSTTESPEWQQIGLPVGLTVVHAAAITPDGVLWVGGREGLFFSVDRGANWQQLERLPIVDINGLYYSPEWRRLLLTSGQSTVVLGIEPGEKRWRVWDTGWRLHGLQMAEGRMIGASRSDGVIVQSLPPVAETAGR